MLSEGRDDTVPFSLSAILYQRIRNGSRVYARLPQRLGALEPAVPWDPRYLGIRNSITSNRAMLLIFGVEVCPVDSTAECANSINSFQSFRVRKPGRIIPNFRPPRSSIL